MLRFAPPTKDSVSAKNYFDRTKNPSDYFFLEQDQGIWTGKLAERLGLSGVVQKKHYDRMCDHFHPRKDEPLTARRNLSRRVGTQLVFTLPKSISMLAVLNKDERIFTLLRNAATETLALMEEHAGTRVRRRGQNHTQRTGEWASAMFIHTTSRPSKAGEPPDLDLHLHAMIFNATVSDEDESRRKALDLTHVYHDMPFYQAVYHSIVARGMEQMGIAIERRGIEPVAYEVASITRDMVMKFSNRTKQIEAEIKRLGITDPKMKDRMGGNTRLPKNHSEWSESALMKSWWDRLPLEERHRVNNAGHWGRVTPISPGRCVDAAIEHCFSRQSVVQDRRLIEYALRRGVGSVTLEQVEQELKRRDWWSKTDEQGHRLLTTPEMADLEKTLLTKVREGRGRCDPLGELQNDGKIRDGMTLDEYQYQAASQLLGNTDRISVLLGKAGVGKTTTMLAVRDSIESRPVTSAHRKVIALAPSAEASRGTQRSEGFKDATTVADFLGNDDLQRKARGQVIWCDEASMLGVKDMDVLIQTAAKLKARLILSGDTGQHRSVNAGDALRLVVEHGKTRPVKLSQIRRQQNKVYRTAVDLISRGKMASAWTKLEELGAIVEHDDERRRHHELAREYVNALRNGESVLAISPTHAEGKKVTEHIRTHLKVHGIVTGPERTFSFHRNLHLSDDEKKNVAAYEPQQAIYFHKAAPGIRSGSRFTVLGVADETVWVRPQGSVGMRGLPLKHAARFSVYRPEQIAIAKGDLLKITQNTTTIDKKHRLNNGSIYKCSGFDRHGNIRVEPIKKIRRSRQPKTFTLAKDNGYVQHGVCITSMASQSKSIDTILGAIGPESLAAMSQKAWYVMVSRGRKRCKLFMEDAGRVQQVIAGTDDRMLATELIKSRGVRERLEQAHWLRRLKTLPAWADKKRDAPKPKLQRRRSRGVGRSLLNRRLGHER